MKAWPYWVPSIVTGCGITGFGGGTRGPGSGGGLVPVSIPHTVRFPACATNPQASMVNVRNDGAVNNGAKPVSKVSSDAGTCSVASEENLASLARLVAACHGDQVRIEEVKAADPDSEAAADGSLLPGPHAKLAGPTFEEWLATQPDSGSAA